MSKLVRLYPHNPRRGHVLRTYLDPQLGGRRGGMKFLGSRGWYEVSDEVAEELEEVRQKRYDKRSPKAFMIADDADHAKELEAELVDDEDEDAQVGTADAPVKAARPGKRKTATKKKGSAKPRTRRKSKAAAEGADA